MTAKPIPEDPPVHYTANYCEENIWHLCQEPRFAGWPRKVIFISNASRACPLWQQRTAQAGDQPVIWDYHVILLVHRGHWMVWDADSRLPWPVPLPRYLSSTFPFHRQLPPRMHPWFRVVEAEDYVRIFASDRSHMHREDGSWTSPPPPWPAISTPAAAMNLMCFVDMSQTFVGLIVSLDQLPDRLGTPG